SHMTEPSMKYGSVKEYAVSNPSMSEGRRPASSMARRAACALSPSPDIFGTFPMSDSPTPTMATLFFNDCTLFIVCPLPRQQLELRHYRIFAALFKHDFHFVSYLHRQRMLAHDVAHHAHALFQLDERDDIGHQRRKHAQRSAPYDGIAVDRSEARRLGPIQRIRPAVRAKMPGHEVERVARFAMTDKQPPILGAFPVGRGIGIGHGYGK